MRSIQDERAKYLHKAPSCRQRVEYFQLLCGLAMETIGNSELPSSNARTKQRKMATKSHSAMRRQCIGMQASALHPN